MPTRDRARKSQVAPLIAHESDLVSVAPKELSLYEDESLAALTVYTLFWLHEWKLRRTIEAVAVLNWRLFPHKFAMLGYTQFPDAFRTNRSLMQGQPKYRNWLTGAASKGFTLNERGRQLARELSQKFGAPSTETGRALGDVEKLVRTASDKRARSVEPARELARARNTRVFSKWKADELTDRDLIHVHTLLGVFDHTPVAVRQKKLGDLERSARDADDEEMIQFLSTIRTLFGYAFH